MISSMSSAASLYRSQAQLRAADRQGPGAGAMQAGALLIAATGQDGHHSPALTATPQANHSQTAAARYVGPARAALRAEVQNPQPVKHVDMTAFYQDLMNGCQAGPKPVSVLAAEANYAKARGILS